MGFHILDELCNALLDAMVFLRCVSSSCFELHDSFLNYLGSCHRLKKVFLRLGRTNAYDEQDERRAHFFLRNIIPMNAWSLTVLMVKPEYAEYWCFDDSMLEALLLCTHLVLISVCVDGNRARVKHSDNVIVSISICCDPFIVLTKGIFIDKAVEESASLELFGRAAHLGGRTCPFTHSRRQTSHEGRLRLHCALCHRFPTQIRNPPVA